MIRTIMHIDMNAFFASVEQQCNPFLRNKPIAVIGTSRRTVVTTASYQARSFGVKTGMNLREAKRCCPHLILVPGNNAKYTDTCVQFIAIFNRYTPLVELFSIDEAFLDITGSFTLFHTATHIATSIKKEIKDTLGLTCSIGIAPNKLLAKLASGLKKPDGLVAIKHDGVASLLEHLPVNKLCGIGPHLERSLSEQGIKTCGQLGRTLILTIRYSDFTTFTRQRTLKHSIDNTHPIYHNVLKILNAITLKQPVRLLGVSISNLLPIHGQLALFEKEQKRGALTSLMDDVNDRYGEFTLTWGTLLLTAPISSSHIPGNP